MLFLCDYDLSGFGPWDGDAYSSIEKTITSVEQLRGIRANVWITSHGNGIFGKAPGKLWDQYLDVFNQREKQILQLIEKPQTLESIVGARICYGKPREPRVFYEAGERALVKKHLQRLMG